MAATEAAKSKERSWPAIIGWGGLALFSILFAWLISTQLGEGWVKREDEALKIAKDFRPDGTDTLYDLTRAYSF